MTHEQEMTMMGNVLDHLRDARDLLKVVDCPKTVNKVRSAIRSAEGAYRHVSLRPYAEERKANNFLDST